LTRGRCRAQGHCPHRRQDTGVGCTTAAVPTEGDLEQEQITPFSESGAGAYRWGVVSTAGPPHPPKPGGRGRGRPGHRPQQTCNPASDYKCFNSSNVSIRPWSWNYRSCWHQTCPPVDTHHCVWIASIPSPACHEGQAGLLQFVAASPEVSQHWAICVPAALLRSGSRLSGSLSGVKP